MSIPRSLHELSNILVRFSRKLHFIVRFSNKYSYTKFHENQLNGSRVVLNGRTDLANVIVAFAILRTRKGGDKIVGGQAEGKTVIRFKCEDITK